MGQEDESVAETVNMGTCKYCNRHFIMDRLVRHEKVCLTKHKGHGPGTDAASPRIGRSKTPNKGASKLSMYSSAAAAAGITVPNNSAINKNNWRKNHKDFIGAIRAAKQTQAYLLKGGNLSDIPPPPPSENPDYVQCPHCLRRFNQAAAERHIPKCATMIHNKPKDNTQGQRKHPHM